LRHSRDLAEGVIKGSISLDEALAKVEEQKQQASSAEARLERLRAAAPDLAARVADENLSVDEALAILRQREEDERRMKADGRAAAESIFGAAQLAAIHAAIEAGEDIRLKPSRVS
jgi:hypothetical protein